MAGTATPTASGHGSSGRYTAMKTYSVVLTSTAGGAVSGNPQTVIPGRLVQVQVTPSAGGVQPSDDFDLTLLNAAGVDLLAGTGTDHSNATSSLLVCDPPVVLTTDLTIDPVLANAGNAKSVTVTLYVEPF